MLSLTDEQWNKLFDIVDDTISKAIDDLPAIIQIEAEKVGCIVDKYHDLTGHEGWIVLGCYLKGTNGPIVIYIGQIYESNHQNMDATIQSIRQVYYHELAHAVGNLEEFEVEERGL